MVRRIVTYPDPVLRKEACEVDSVSDEVKRLAEDMRETMYENRGIGLAAPQVGEDLRMITVDTSGSENQSGLIVLLNPVIEESAGWSDKEEACLSLPGFKCKVRRADRITVRGKDLDGNERRLDADGLLAVCLQHEIDHLDGVVLLDRVSSLKRSLYEKKIRKWRQEQ
jgi:peptide deformylase